MRNAPSQQLCNWLDLLHGDFCFVIGMVALALYNTNLIIIPE